MTVTDSPSQPVILLSDKLMTINNLNNLIPVKLDVDEMNYSSWVYFFHNLCRGYSLIAHIEIMDEGDSSSGAKPTPDAEWLKIDTIILSWIFITLSKTLQQRLVVDNPQSAKQAWDILADIFHDNKRTRSIALKAELRSLKLGDMSIDAYFRKIESIATVLTSLGSTMDNDDVVTFALEGLPARFDNIATIIAHRDPFPDLKSVRSMLTTEEMRLKARVQDAYVNTTSSSPMVLLENSSSNTRRSFSSTEKVNKPCFNFNKGSCRFGAVCKFLHNGVHGIGNRMSHSNDIPSSPLSPTDVQTLQSLLAKLGCHGNISLKQPIGQNNATNTTTNSPLALHTSHNPGYALINSPPGFHGPPRFYNPTTSFVSQTSGPSVTTSNLAVQPTQLGQFMHPVHFGQTGQFGHHGQVGQMVHSGQTCQNPTTVQQSIAGPTSHLTGQETLLPHAFTVGTLQDPAVGNWNMDTGLPNSSGDAPL